MSCRYSAVSCSLALRAPQTRNTVAQTDAKALLSQSSLGIRTGLPRPAWRRIQRVNAGIRATPATRREMFRGDRMWAPASESATTAST